MYVYSACTSVSHMCSWLVPAEATKGSLSHSNWSYRRLWAAIELGVVLGFELGDSGRAESACS